MVGAHIDLAKAELGDIADALTDSAVCAASIGQIRRRSHSSSGISSA